MKDDLQETIDSYINRIESNYDLMPDGARKLFNRVLLDGFITDALHDAIEDCFVKTNITQTMLLEALSVREESYGKPILIQGANGPHCELLQKQFLDLVKHKSILAFKEGSVVTMGFIKYIFMSYRDTKDIRDGMYSHIFTDHFALEYHSNKD